MSQDGMMRLIARLLRESGRVTGVNARQIQGLAIVDVVDSDGTTYYFTLHTLPKPDAKRIDGVKRIDAVSKYPDDLLKRIKANARYGKGDTE